MLPALFVSSTWAASIAAPGVIGGVDAGAATPNPAALHYNAAAIGASEGFHFLLDGQAAFIGVTATASRNDGIDPNTGETYTPIHANVLVPLAFVGATWQVWPKRLTLGLAVDDPFVGGGKYLDETGAPDTTAHGRYHGIDVALLTVAVSPSVAVTVVPGFHVGGGVSYVVDHVAALQAADPLGTEGVAPEELGLSPPANPYAYDVLLGIEATGSHWGWNAGLFLDRWEKLQVGIGYQSGGTFHARGTAEVDVPAALSTTSQAATIDGDAEFILKLPPIARLYLASQATDRLRLGAGLDLELWNICCGTDEGDVHIIITNDEGQAIGPDDGVSLDIAKDQYSPSRLWNAAGISAYGGYTVTDQLWLGARLAYNQYAVPSYSVNPVNLDFDNVGVLVGARYAIGEHVEVGVGYTHYFLFTRTVTDSAWNLGDGNTRFSPALPYKSNADGTYSGAVNSFGLRLGLDF